MTESKNTLSKLELSQRKNKNRAQEGLEAKRRAFKIAICEAFDKSTGGLTIEQIVDAARNKYGYGKPTAQKYLNEMVGNHDISEFPGKPTIYKLSDNGKNMCKRVLEEKE
jgi:ABC-type microcin C transport system permease subunit YejB